MSLVRVTIRTKRKKTNQGKEQNMHAGVKSFFYEHFDSGMKITKKAEISTDKSDLDLRL